MPSIRVRSSAAGALASVAFAFLGCSSGGSGGGPGDTTPPTVVSRFPAASATGVWPVGAVVTATFSEAMDPATVDGSTFVLRDAIGARVAGSVGYSGTTASFTPASQLAWLTTYTATVSAGARDASGNALTGPVSWSFTTAQEPDATMPTIVSYEPAANASGVAPDAPVTVTFSEPMEEASTSAALTLEGPGGTPVTASVVVQGAIATLTPAAPLAELTPYVATVSTSARDLHGNQLAAGALWSFTTADVTAPSVTSVYPPAAAANVDVGVFVDVVFSEQVDPLSLTPDTFQLRDPLDVPVAGTIHPGGNGAWFSPAAPLAPGTSYTVAIAGVTDLAGNPLAPALSSAFTTTGAGSGSWAPMAAADPLEPYAARAGPGAVWTGSEVLVWGGWYQGAQGQVYVHASGGRYSPGADAWQPIPSNLPGTPSGRSRHATVWTGSRMIAWGGSAPGGVTGTGGVYDPSVGASGSWTATSLAAAPAARADPVAAWTGSEMIVWGGWDPGGVGIFHGTGGRYAVGTDTWAATSELGAPSPRVYASAVWSGSRLLVWGGLGGNGPLGDGASYDPVADAWEPLPAGGPSARWNAAAVWDGSRMIVWGGTDSAGALGDGAAYDPVARSWTALSSLGAPPPRERPSAAWTGTRMIVWGGAGTNPFATQTGGVYDPATDAWTLTALSGAPSPRRQAAAVWTGTQLVVWGGWGSASILKDGARFTPP